MLYLVINFFVLFSFLLVVLFVLSLKQGYVNLTLKQFIKVILGNHPDQLFHDIVFMIRLPRALTAILIGALLSVAGCVTQATLRNDLAEPYLLGISSGAAFGAALAIVSGFYAVTGMAFFFAMTALLIVILCAAPSRFSILSIILSGVMVNTFFDSIVFTA
jgi:iron complex transport system permease protein